MFRNLSYLRELPSVNVADWADKIDVVLAFMSRCNELVDDGEGRCLASAALARMTPSASSYTCPLRESSEKNRGMPGYSSSDKKRTFSRHFSTRRAILPSHGRLGCLSVMLEHDCGSACFQTGHRRKRLL